MKTPNKQYYTVEQIAALLQVHWQTVLNLIKRGDLEALKIGRGYRISPQALEVYLQRHSTKREQP